MTAAAARFIHTSTIKKDSKDRLLGSQSTMMDRLDTSFDNIEVASEMIHSSSSSSHGSSRNSTIDDSDCGSIHQAMSMKRRRVVGQTHDVLDTDEGVVDDLAAAVQGDNAVTSATCTSADAFIDRSVLCINSDTSATMSPSGSIGDVPPFTSSNMSTRDHRRRTDRRSFRIANANAAMTAVLSFVLICTASAATATAKEAILGDGVGVPTLDGRFQRRHVTTATSTTRTNLRRSSSSTAYSEVVLPEENSVGRRMADFFTDRKAEPLEFRIENVNRLRPSQSEEESDMAAVTNTQNYLPPLSPSLEKRATIVFHQPTIDSGIHNKATYISSQPAQTGSVLPQQQQYQPHGGTHWHEAANFGPQIQFGAMIPSAELSFHSPPTTPTENGYSLGREEEFQQSITYQNIEEDYQNFYKQTQEEKDETAKARVGLLEKLYGSSLEKPSHSADIGENSVSNRGPTGKFAATATSANDSSNPSPLQGRVNDVSYTLVGNSIAVVVPGEPDPIPTQYTVDPSNNNCVRESGCTIFYSTSTNNFVDANGDAVGVNIDIVETSTTGGGGTTTTTGAGTSTTGGGGTTTMTTTTETTETVVTEENTTSGNNSNGDEGDDDDEDEASGPTMEPTADASDSADEDSAEHSGKGYSSRSGKGKGKGKGSSR